MCANRPSLEGRALRHESGERFLRGVEKIHLVPSDGGWHIFDQELTTIESDETDETAADFGIHPKPAQRDRSTVAAAPAASEPPRALP